MRILFVIHTWPPEGRGGSEHHAHEVALALQARGHQVGVFCRTGDPDLGRYEVTTGLQDEIGVTRFNNLYWHSPTFEWIYKNRWAHEAFLAEVEEFKPDLVHIHHFIGLSTTIVEALASGARGVIPTTSAEDAVRLAALLGREDTLLCGERKGAQIEGFDLGNSPGDFSAEIVRGKRLVMSTTNGTVAFSRAQEADRVLACAFTNLGAVAEAVGGEDSLVVVCAGRQGRFSLEDAVCAGHLLLRLLTQCGFFR